jgi:hypothetical protein
VDGIGRGGGDLHLHAIVSKRMACISMLHPRSTILGFNCASCTEQGRSGVCVCGWEGMGVQKGHQMQCKVSSYACLASMMLAKFPRKLWVR